MRIDQTSPKTTALTLLESVVVMAVMVVLIGVLMPALNRGKAQSSRLSCVNCLKQVGLAGRIFATDNEGNFPWQVSTNAGGSREYLASPNSAFRHFLALSNELSATRLLLCPQDKERTPAIDWRIGNQNISYFVGLNASETNANSFLSGDRNLQTSGVPVGSGLLELATNVTIGWTAQMHKNSGNVLFGDGHVDSMSNNRLQQQLISSGVASNRLLIP